MLYWYIETGDLSPPYTAKNVWKIYLIIKKNSIIFVL